MESDTTPVPLPSASSVQVAPNIILQPPLSRRGHGPGLVLLVSQESPLTTSPHSLDPPPLQKWAEEGYAVAQISVSADGSKVGEDFHAAISALSNLPECDQSDRIGLIAYVPLPAGAQDIDTISNFTGVIFYSAPTTTAKSQLIHLVGVDVVAPAGNNVTTYKYPSAKSAGFVLPGHQDFDASAAAISHTRCLTFLKHHTCVGGPLFDLEAIWEEHTAFEFGNRSVENTMGTMVQEPYVNHVPTMTGGIGRDNLTSFYRKHFIWNNPEDTGLELVSRTVGVDRVIDEFVFCCTHDRVIDWLVPGVPPTGRALRIPFTSVVNIRGDRLYHEHIAWDQATVLVQLGLLPQYLPFPYALPDGKKPAPGKRFEYQVPAAGSETAAKLVDENAGPSNTMFDFKIREVDQS